MAVALVGLSAVMVSLAKGSRPGLPAGEQHWSSGWAGGSAKWHPVHPSSSCGMPQQPEKKRKAWISAPLHKSTASEITEAVGINTDFFFQAKIVFSPAVQ